MGIEDLGCSSEPNSLIVVFEIWISYLPKSNFTCARSRKVFYGVVKSLSLSLFQYIREIKLYISKSSPQCLLDAQLRAEKKWSPEDAWSYYCWAGGPLILRTIEERCYHWELLANARMSMVAEVRLRTNQSLHICTQNFILHNFFFSYHAYYNLQKGIMAAGLILKAEQLKICRNMILHGLD